MDNKNIPELANVYNSLLNTFSNAIIIVDSDSKIIFWNDGAKKLFYYKSKEIIGKSINIIIPDAIYNNKVAIREIISFKKIQNIKKSISSIGLRKDGIEIKVEISISFWKSNNSIFYTLIISDITVQKKKEEKLRYKSFHDTLTGLYNRAYFEEELKRLDTSRQLPLSMLIGDINGLKLINDAFGYKEGDLILKGMADILKKSCRADDIIARWGGDEFVIMLPNTCEDVVGKIISRVRRECEKFNYKNIPLNISLGFSTKVKINQEISDIIREAESRMKEEKLLESKKIAASIIKYLKKSLWESDSEAKSEAERIKNMAIKLAKAAKLPRSEIDNLILLSTFKDIGEIAIKRSLIESEKEFGEEDWMIIKRHPEIGYRIAKSSTQLASITEAILAHHENWDGSGYPHKLTGTSIPQISRIIAIIDAYNAMVYGRQYKKAISKEEAVEELKRCSGKQFDPKLVNVFVDILKDKEKELSLFKEIE
ncbi:MAG: diguanylate cyclase [Actinobacteria bacterium]|nr:diguanylate cyclase [Actinomycetota bacterium]MBL7123517.1 diguanylate cyclase [Actinomycetota bacterium]